jgi:UDP-glucose 4-epimerase
MKTALVTGAAGFLGRNTVSALKRDGYAVYGLGHAAMEGEVIRDLEINKWIEADITLKALNGLNWKFDLIVHCAGSSSVGFSIVHPMDDFNKTVNTTVALLEYMRLKNRDARLIYPSSAAVYGLKEDQPLREDAPLNPVSPYGYHKKITEELCESYAKNFTLKITVVRFFSLYGNGLKKQLLWEACNKFMDNEQSILFFGSGEETRDWLHIRDAVELICAVSRTTDGVAVLNGGSGKRVTVKEILEFMNSEFGRGQELLFNGEVRAGDPRFYRADISRANSLGWEPTVDWHEGVRDYVRWFRSGAL